MGTHKRQCIVCRQLKTKADMIRLVRRPDGHVVLDPTGKINGRGCYICKDPQCIEEGFKKRKLNHALKTKIDSKTVEELIHGLEKE